MHVHILPDLQNKSIKTESNQGCVVYRNNHVVTNSDSLENENASVLSECDTSSDTEEEKAIEDTACNEASNAVHSSEGTYV